MKILATNLFKVIDKFNLTTSIVIDGETDFKQIYSVIGKGNIKFLASKLNVSGTDLVGQLLNQLSSEVSEEAKSIDFD